MSKEMEKRFLINRNFPINNLMSLNIIQGYILTDRGIIRIRSIEDDCYLTIKEGSGEIRDEFETPINEKTFKILSRTVSSWIKKIRYMIYQDNNITWTVDSFLYPNISDYYIGEMEYKTLVPFFTTPNQLIPHIITEITENNFFTSYNLSLINSDNIQLEIERNIK